MKQTGRSHRAQWASSFSHVDNITCLFILHRAKEAREKEERDRVMKEHRRRQEEARLNALPVSASIIVQPVVPNMLSRTGFDINTVSLLFLQMCSNSNVPAIVPSFWIKPFRSSTFDNCSALSCRARTCMIYVHKDEFRHYMLCMCIQDDPFHFHVHFIQNNQWKK